MFEEIQRLRKIKSKKIRQKGYDKLESVGLNLPTIVG